MLKLRTQPRPSVSHRLLQSWGSVGPLVLFGPSGSTIPTPDQNSPSAPHAEHVLDDALNDARQDRAPNGWRSWRHNGPEAGGGRGPHRDDGMNTAEYAVGTLAAVAFAGVLLKVLTSDAVRNALASIVQRALQ